MSDFDKLLIQISYPYQSLMDQMVQNSATSALGIRATDSLSYPLQSLINAEVQLARQVTSARQAAREIAEIQRMNREMEGMRWFTRHLEETRRLKREMEEMTRFSRDMQYIVQANRDAEILKQGLADTVQRGIAKEIVNAEEARRQIVDALLQRELDRDKDQHGTPTDETDAPSPRAEAKRVVEIPPGATLLAWAQVWCSAKTIELVVEPIIADYRHEIFEALSQGRSEGTIRAIHVRYRIAFVEAIFRSIVGVVGRILKAAKG